MVFYFGFSVVSFFTLYVSCDILVPAEKYEETSQAAEGSFFLLFLCFCLSSSSPWSNVIGSDLFFCSSNYGSKCGII